MAKKNCCPRFNVKKWQKREFAWKDKPFITGSIPQFLHVPFPPMIASALNKLMKPAVAAGKLAKDPAATLILFNDPHPFRSDIYMSVTGEVPGAKNTRISGRFISMVFDGPYNAIPLHIKAMQGYLEKKGRNALDYYVHYAYCPKCAEKYGHNHTLIIARVADEGTTRKNAAGQRSKVKIQK